MFELKKGMKAQITNDKIYTFDRIEIIDGYETYCMKEKIQNILGFHKIRIDFEETAKLNGIDLKEEQNLVTFKNLTGYIDKEVGYKETKGKIRPNLLPITELKDVIRVFEYGVEKYSKDNWKHVKEPINEYGNALSRHLLDYLEGEKKASDSNLPHLAHICANALILMWFENNKAD